MTEPPQQFRFTTGDLAAIDLVEIDAGVFVTPLLTLQGCARLLKEVDARRALGLGSTRAPNSMHEHGAMLTSLGLNGVVETLRARLAPELARLFTEVGGDTLDDHHSYLVEYGPGLDEDLGFHVDDSEVTLNLCLGDRFSGAELVLLGRRCDLHRQDPVLPGEAIEIEHEPGTAVLHAGKHRHRVDPILRGVRRNLIAWLKSSDLRAAEADLPPACRPWCGHHGV